MVVGEPEDAVWRSRRSASLDRPGRRLPASRGGGPTARSWPRWPGQLRGLPVDALSRRGTCCRSALRLPMVERVRTSSSRPAAAAPTRATSAWRRSIRATSSASATRRRWSTRSSGRSASSACVLLPVGRHRHAQRQDVQRVLRRADRARPRDPVVRQCPRRQPDRSRPSSIGCASRAAGCSRWASSRRRREIAQGHGEAARGGEDPDGASPTCATPASSRSRSSSSAIRAIRRSRWSDHRLRDRSRSGLRELLSGGALPRHGALREVRKRDGLLASEDWSRMEYSVLPARGNGLDEQVVMEAINRAKRRFFLRPRYLAEAPRGRGSPGLDQAGIVTHLLSSVLFGQKVVDVSPSRLALQRKPTSEGHETGVDAGAVACRWRRVVVARSPRAGAADRTTSRCGPESTSRRRATS